MKRIAGPLVPFLFCAFAASAQKVELNFEVTYKGKNIGTMHVTEERVNDMIVRDLRTNTDAKIIVLAIHVESELNITHQNGQFTRGTAYRHANRGVEDVHTNVTRKGEKAYQCDRNGKSTLLKDKEISLCIVDICFVEPKGVTEVFSTMWGQFVPVKTSVLGQYIVTTPDGYTSTFTYQQGKLVKVEMDTAVGMVTSHRI